MRILIIGGGGMLGHELWCQLHADHEVWVTLRRPATYYARFGLFSAEQTISGLDVNNEEELRAAFIKARPEAVINCVGIVKQMKEAKVPLVSVAINSLLPHRLFYLSKLVGARLVHISTDCVFSGSKGMYTEDDESDANDLYGRTKFLGEVHDEGAITIRTSIIGRELETQTGLLEWFLSQEGQTIQGYRKSIYSGLTTLEVAAVLQRILIKHPQLSGLWQVTSDPISKYDLLLLAQKAFGWHGRIIPNDSVACDRSMDSSRFRSRTNYQPPTWEAMVHKLAKVGKSR